MSNAEIRGPLDVFVMHDDVIATTGIDTGSDLLTLRQWVNLLDARRRLIKKMWDLFYPPLRNCFDKCFTIEPGCEEAAMTRGVFFHQANCNSEGASMFCGINPDGEWLLVTLKGKWNGDKFTIRSIDIQPCTIEFILEHVIDPLNLFRWMNYWLKGLRDRRAQAFTNALQLETVFAEQDHHVKAHTSADEYNSHQLAAPPS